MEWCRANTVFLLGIAIALLFWFLESIIHMLVFREPVLEWWPHDANELWMRLFIVFLIVVIGYIAQRQIRVQSLIHEEKVKTLKATMVTVQDIVGNALNNILLFRMQAEQKGMLNDASLQELEDLVMETAARLNELAQLEEVPEIQVAANLYAIDLSRTKGEAPNPGQE